MDIEIDALIALMGQLNAKSPPKDAPGAYLITINDMVIKAAAATLRKVPAVNASWTDDGMAFYDDVDISVAVSIPDGLITPIIRQADVKGPGDDQPRDEGSGRARSRREAEARGIPGRRVLDLQHGDVRGVVSLPRSSTRLSRRFWRWRRGVSGRS